MTTTNEQTASSNAAHRFALNWGGYDFGTNTLAGHLRAIGDELEERGFVNDDPQTRDMARILKEQVAPRAERASSNVADVVTIPRTLANTLVAFLDGITQEPQYCGECGNTHSGDCIGDVDVMPLLNELTAAIASSNVASKENAQ